MSTMSDALQVQVPRAPGSGVRVALVAFTLTLVTGLAGTVGAVLGYEQAFEGRIMPGVMVAGVEVGGLDRATAAERVAASLPDSAADALTLRVGDASTVVTYGDLDRRYDLDPVLDAAMAVGRTGGPLERPGEQLRSLTRGTSLDGITVAYETAALDAAVAQLSASLEQPVEDSRVLLRTDDGRDARWEVVPSQVGVSVDEAALRASAVAALDALGATTAATEVGVAPLLTEPAFTTADAEAAAARANSMTAAGLTLRHDEASWTLSVDTLRAWLTVRRTDDDAYAVDVRRSAIEAMLPDLLAELTVPAIEATFRFRDGGVVAVPGAPGQDLDTSVTVDRIVAALEARAAGTTGGPVDVATVQTQPGLSTAEAEAAAPRVRRVSSWTTRFPVWEANFFGKNISIPTSKIDGQVVAPGRWFDFWKAVGFPSREDGYGPGGAIINGRTKITGALGGGICSCSTTLFNAALRAGLEIGKRKNHYYYISRYPVGLDATVWISSSGAKQTMRFRNDTDYPILIKGINRYGLVRFEIWTVPTGRTVELSDPIIRSRRNAHDTIEYTDRLAPGRRQRIEWPADGFRAWVTRTVRDREGTILHEETYYSRYATVDGVVLVGRRPGDPPAGTVIVTR